MSAFDGKWRGRGNKSEKPNEFVLKPPYRAAAKEIKDMQVRKNERQIADMVVAAEKPAPIDISGMLATIEKQKERIRTLELELALIRCQQ